jgi:pentatricopeptide repeat protein
MKIMKDRGVKHTAFSITPMISLYGKIGDTIKADALFEMMKREGIKRDPSIYNSLMKCHANDTSKVDDLFTQMKEDGIKPNVITYNTMIDVYAKNGKALKAIEVFDSMKKGEIKPDVYTYNTMIDAYSKSGQLEKAIEMFASMKKDGIKPDVTLFGALLDCYAKSGKHLDDIMYILKEIKGSSVVPNIRIWNNILEGFSRADGEKDQKKKALSIWKYLSGAQSYESLGMILPVKAMSVTPDAATLSIALDVCKHGRFEKEAHDVWKYGQDNDRVVLDSNVLTSYVECLASFGEKGADRAQP